MRTCELRLVAFFLGLSLVASEPIRAQEFSTRTVNNGNVVLDGVPEIPPDLGALLNRYQNVRAASFQDWTEDGRAIYITTRFGEVSQLHRVDRPGGARRQLTFFGEPVRAVSRRPNGVDLVFRMDQGGSEFFQLFAYEPETSEHRRLTDGSSRNGTYSWRGDGSVLAFQSTRRDGQSNDVWVMDVRDTSSARLVLEAPDGTWWAPADWHPDGNQLLIMNYISITDSRIHLLNLATGESRRLLRGDESPASYLGITPMFSDDGSGVFLATDAEGDFTQLAYLDLASGDMSVITSQIPWDVGSFAMSQEGDVAAFVTNEGGVSQLYLLDTSTLEFEPVESIPLGIISDLEFSPDGSELGFTLNTAKTPSDVFSISLGEDFQLTRWTYSEVGGLDTDAFVAPELITYPTFDTDGDSERMIPAFVYRPSAPGPHPVIVYIHGGPESQYRPGFSSTFQLWVATLGAAVVAPNVRGSSGYGKNYVRLDNGYLRENSVRDIGALLDWIETQPDLDENRVAVYGGSYGGYMSLASAVHYSDRLRAAVDIVGISNFVTFLENTQAYRRDLRRPEYGDERDPEMRAFLESISPNRNVDRITVPLFVAQGQNDPRVPVTESEQIVRELRENGRQVWYMNALNEGHGFGKKENRDLYREIVVMFLERYLLGEQPVTLVP